MYSRQIVEVAIIGLLPRSRPVFTNAFLSSGRITPDGSFWRPSARARRHFATWRLRAHVDCWTLGRLSLRIPKTQPTSLPVAWEISAIVRRKLPRTLETHPESPPPTIGSSFGQSNGGL